MKAQVVSIAFALILFQMATATAQTTPVATDVVHLISGQTHRGIVIEQKPGESIRLWRTVEGDTLTFGMDEIERIARVLPSTEAASGGPITPANAPSSAFNNNPWSTALQLSVGGGDYPLGGIGVVVQQNFHKQRAHLGLGLSFVGDVNHSSTNSLALFAHGSREFSTSRKGRLGSLAFLDLGYSFNLGKPYFDGKALTDVRYGNGLHLHTGLRFRVNVLRNAGLWVDIGYLRHSSTLRTVAEGDKVRQKAWNMAVLRGSIFF